MTGYLLRWQLLFFRRHLFTVQSMIPLAVNVLFQGILIASLFGSAQDFQQNIVMVVAYSSSFALSQTTAVYVQVLAVASSGLLGIAPIPPRPKVAMALVEMLFAAALQALVIALGLGVALMFRVSVPGGLAVMLLTFLSGLFVYGGLAAGLTALFSLILPPKMRAAIPAFSGILYFITMGLYLLAEHRFPRVLTAIANVFLRTARHPFAAGGDTLVFVVAAVAGIAIGVIPMARSYGKILLQPLPIGSQSSKTYAAARAPHGVLPLFLWRERIAVLRNRATLILIVIGAGALVVLPQDFGSFVFVMLGIQAGASVFSMCPPKSISLFYLLPLSPSQLWKARMIAMAPLTALATVIFLITMGIRTPSLDAGHLLCALTLPAAGLVGASFLVMLNPSIYSNSGAGQKRTVRSTLSMSLLFSFAPIGLAALSDKLPWPGLVVNLGIIFGVLYFGRTWLDARSAVRYPFRT